MASCPGRGCRRRQSPLQCRCCGATRPVAGSPGWRACGRQRYAVPDRRTAGRPPRRHATKTLESGGSWRSRMASRSDKSGATGGGAPQRKVAVIESALADELAAMTLEQKELLQRTGAGSVGWVRLAAYRTQIADVVDGYPIPWPCGFATAVGLRPN